MAKENAETTLATRVDVDLFITILSFLKNFFRALFLLKQGTLSKCQAALKKLSHFRQRRTALVE
jgi:hypothetical protein